MKKDELTSSDLFHFVDAVPNNEVCLHFSKKYEIKIHFNFKFTATA